MSILYEELGRGDRLERQFSGSKEKKGHAGEGLVPFDLCRLLVNSLDIGVLMMDSEFNVLLANRAAARLCDLREDPVGKKCFTVLGRGKQACSACPGVRVLAGRKAAVLEMECPVEGAPRTLSFKALPLPAPASGFVLILEDVTERRQAENALREAFREAERARDRIDSILSSVLDGLIVTDKGGRIVLMNAAAETLLSLKQPQLFQHHLADCITDRHLLRRLLRAVETGEDGASFDFELPSAGGIRDLTILISQVRSREGECQGTVFLLRDVTRERELGRMKSEFISTAAHELRTPLTSILGFSELLLVREDLPPGERHDFLQFIHRKAENLSLIISDLLDISRIEAGRGLELTKEERDLHGLIRETAASYCSASPLHHLELDIPEEPLPLEIDGSKIVQVLENLLSNAFKYSPRGGRIRLASGPVRGGYLVSVQDEGIGMTREQTSRAFEKFYRADSSNTAVEGTGLGLSITRYIVEAHGGRIWIESRKAKGTTVFFTIPVRQEVGSREAGR